MSDWHYDSITDQDVYKWGKWERVSIRIDTRINLDKENEMEENENTHDLYDWVHVVFDEDGDGTVDANGYVWAESEEDAGSKAGFAYAQTFPATDKGKKLEGQIYVRAWE